MEDSIEIDRPVEEVFAFLSNVENFPEWSGVVVEVSKDVPGPAKEGDRFTLAQKFLGRRFDSPCEIIGLEPNRSFGYRTTGGGPIPFTFIHTVEPIVAGTRVTIRAEGEPGSFFRLAGPLFEKAGKRQVRTDLETLKDILESPQQPAPA